MKLSLKHIRKRLYEKLGFQPKKEKAKIDTILKTFFDCIIEMLAENEPGTRITINGIGSFYCRETKAGRYFVNFPEKDSYLSPSRKVPCFRFCPEVKKRIDGR